VTLDVPVERTVIVSGAARSSTQQQGSRQFSLEPGSNFDIALPRQETPPPAIASALPPMFASRQMTGYGQERGGMHATLRNPHPYSQTIVYLESLPWFLKPYMHTLAIQGGTIEKMYYTPALDRERGTHLELLINIPAHSTVDLNYDFEKAILRYTEYPPDANRGFDVAPAVIRVLSSNASSTGGEREDQYLRTTSLLLPLPTPDFSMPYNVIILTSTVIALGFGSIFNMLVRKFVLLEEVPASPLKTKVAALKEKVAALLGKGTKTDAKTPTIKPPEDQTRSTQSTGSAGSAEAAESMNGGARLRNSKT
jgi:phosphatidylinositol glycan class T